MHFVWPVEQRICQDWVPEYMFGNPLCFPTWRAEWVRIWAYLCEMTRERVSTWVSQGWSRGRMPLPPGVPWLQIYWSATEVIEACASISYLGEHARIWLDCAPVATGHGNKKWKWWSVSPAHRTLLYIEIISPNHGKLAQMVARGSHNPEVMGSIPILPSFVWQTPSPRSLLHSQRPKRTHWKAVMRSNITTPKTEYYSHHRCSVYCTERSIHSICDCPHPRRHVNCIH